MRPRGLRAQRGGRPPQAVRRLLQPVRHHPRELAPDAGRSVAPRPTSRCRRSWSRSQPFKNDIVVLRGINMESSNERLRADRERARPGDDAHADRDRPGQGAGRARGARTTSSTGRRAARRSTSTSPRRSASQTLLPSLELGVESTDTFLETLVTQDVLRARSTRTTSTSARCPIQPVDDPVQVYTRLTGQHQAGTTEQILAALQNRQSVLDYVRDDYGDLMGQLGSRRPRQAGPAPDQRPRHRDAACSG